MQCTEGGMGRGGGWRGGLIAIRRFPSVGELLPCHNKLTTVEMAPLEISKTSLTAHIFSKYAFFYLFEVFLFRWQLKSSWCFCFVFALWLKNNPNDCCQ